MLLVEIIMIFIAETDLSTNRVFSDTAYKVYRRYSWHHRLRCFLVNNSTVFNEDGAM